ncbi:MAG: hypothetical protein WDO70_00840 [Alphaproteobacteria bacterium]
MRSDLLFGAAAVILTISFPAAAGGLTYKDRSGIWLPTACARPQSPANLAPSSKMSANDLNGQVRLYNDYTAQAQAYMDCVSQEAARDATAAQQVIARDAQKSMEAMEQELSHIQAKLKKHK